MQVNARSLYTVKKRITYKDIRAYVLEKYGIKISSMDIACTKEKCGLIKRTHRVENPRIEHCPPKKEVLVVEALKHFGIL